MVFVKNKSNYKGNKNKNFIVFVNEQIRAPNIVIVDGEGNKLGMFPRKKAFEMANEKGLDLVQMNYDPQKMVSTVKMIDYGKYMYQKQKDEKEKKKKQKVKGFKSIKLSYQIGENDLKMKTKKIEELLKEGYNVKVLMRLKGRENAFANLAIEKLMSVVKELEDFGKSQFSTPKKEAQGYSISLFTKIKG